MSLLTQMTEGKQAQVVVAAGIVVCFGEFLLYTIGLLCVRVSLFCGSPFMICVSLTYVCLSPMCVSLICVTLSFVGLLS